MNKKPGLNRPLSERLKEITADADAARAAAKAPPAAPRTTSSSPQVSRSYNPHLSLGPAFKYAFWGGLIGLSIYTVPKLLSPGANLLGAAKDLLVKAVKAPGQLRDKYPGLKGQIASGLLVLAEVTAGALGISKVNDVYHDVKDSGSITSYASGHLANSKNKNAFLLGGVYGSVVKIFANNHERTLEGNGDIIESAEIYAYDLYNAAGEVASWVNDHIPSSGETSSVQRSGPSRLAIANMEHGNVELCMVPTPTTGDQSEYANYHNKLDNASDDLRFNVNSDLYKAFKKTDHVQLIAAPYTSGFAKVTVTTGSSCPDGLPKVAEYNAKEWQEKTGYILPGIKPL